MIRIPIQGIEDGKKQFDLEIPVDEIEEIYKEFFGIVSISVTLVKLHNRYTVTGNMSCKVKLVCDRSLIEYEEEIKAKISTSYIDGAMIKNEEEYNENTEIKTISDDAKYIDITQEVCQLLTVNIPMKKIAPEYRGKDLNEIFPEYDPDKKDENKIDERWSGLKKLKFN